MKKIIIAALSLCLCLGIVGCKEEKNKADEDYKKLMQGNKEPPKLRLTTTCKDGKTASSASACNQ